ncbi:MAG: O-antigen ligase family protein [Candidatus Uhrbacteria bacterium]
MRQLTPQNRERLIFGLPAVIAGVAALFIGRPSVLGIIALLLAIGFTAWKPMIGWVLTVLAYPFIYLQLFVGGSVNVPYVDLFAMITAVGLAAHLAWQWKYGRPSSLAKGKLNLPGILPFVLFIAAAALSLIHVADLGGGVKFLFRPLTFFYLMFIALPAFVIDRPKRLFTTLRVMFVVGCIAAAMGAWSLVFPLDPGGLRRAVPIIVYGMTPLGTNHNLIAEVLVSIIPIGMVLALFASGAVRRWYVVGTVLFGVVTLLTFSRNGWLTLAVEGVVLLIAIAKLYGWSWKRIARYAVPAVAVVLIAIGAFSMTSVARSSNTNRMRLTEIALEQFLDHPFIGGGVGTFREVVGRDRWYVADFGEPQEAHGLIQKLLAETGILGLTAFLALLAAIVRYIIRVYRSTASTPQWRVILLALLCSTFGSIVFQLFNTSYFVSKLWLPLGIAVAAARLAERGIALREAP